MEKGVRKKIIVVGAILLFVFLLLGILFFFLLKDQDEEYSGEPIMQDSLPQNDIGTINIADVAIDEREKYTIWGVSNKVSLSEIQDMMFSLNLSLSLQEQKEGSYYYWSDDKGNLFQYTLLRNSLIFNLVDGIPWDEVTLTQNSFSNLVREYFDSPWEYRSTNTLNLRNRERLYYARRLTQDGWPIERTPNLHQETDYLILRDGKIIAGEIFLTYFFDTEIRVPLLGSDDLTKYINDPKYPKTINVRPDQIATSLGFEEEYAYMDMDILEIQQKLDDCKALSYTVVYLYKSFEQEFLTPVYRLALECTIEYEGSEYSVPAVGYVNAVDPEYIVVPE